MPTRASRIATVIHPDSKGLFRTALVGPGNTIRAAFETIARDPGPCPRRVDPRWNSAYTHVDLPAGEGTGCWKPISISDEIDMIVTDCDYTSPRFENLPSEGLVEFHFVLEGPAELAVPRPEEPSLTTSVVMACHQAPGVGHDVCCLPGRFRMISLYVRPELLADSFGFGTRPDSPAQRLMRPAPGAMALAEVATTVEIVTALREVFALEFVAKRDLMMVVARVFELLSLTTALPETAPADSHASIAFTQRELAMFARVMKMLSDPDTAIAIAIAMSAHAVGYDHQASFTTAFNAYFGLPPKQARKLAGNPASSAGRPD